MLDFCKPRFSEIRNWGSSWSEPMSNLQSRRPFEQSHQIHLHSSALATRSPKSAPTFRIWRSNWADWRRLPRPGPPKATNRPPLYNLGDPFRRNGRSFHDLATGRPKSVVVLTIWRTESPNRSLISCSGKQRRKIRRRSCLKAARAAQNAPDKRAKATWIHWDRDLRSWPTPLETLKPPEVRINGQKALAKAQTASPSFLKSSRRR
jgi:hypothetical protein